MAEEKRINQQAKELIDLLKYRLGMTQEKLSEKLGRNPQYLSGVLNGKMPFSDKLAKDMRDLLESTYAGGISTLETSCLKDSGTPVYNIDATSDSLDKDICKENIIGHVNLPEISPKSIIVTATGDSMSGIINDKDKIVIREIENKEMLIYGQIYLVLTREYKLLKYLRRHPSHNERIILESKNKQFDNIEIAKADILRLFLVENVLVIRNLI